tara:strand:+ start:132 stop:368 length:237 start_codon:yes stop_codon:yes gene_type:complete
MIKLYTISLCSSCDRARNFLKSKKIDFKEVDVSLDLQAQRDLIKRSGQMGVPVIDINGILLIGFNKDALTQMLKEVPV